MTSELRDIRSLLKKAVRSGGVKDVPSYLLGSGIAQKTIDQHKKHIRDIYFDCLADAAVGLESQSSGSESEPDRRRRSSRTRRASKESRETSPSTFSSPSNSQTSTDLSSTNEGRECEARESVHNLPKKPDAYGKIWVTDEHRRPVTCVFSTGPINYIGEHIITEHFNELDPRRKKNRISLQFGLDTRTRTRIIDFVIKADYPHDILLGDDWDIVKKPPEMRNTIQTEQRPAEGMERTTMQGQGKSLPLRSRNNGVKSEGSDVDNKPRRERQSERASTPNLRLPTAGGRIDHPSRSNSPLVTHARSRTQSTPIPGLNPGLVPGDTSVSSVTMSSSQSSEPIKVVVEIRQPQPQPAWRSQLPRRRRLQNNIGAMSSSSCFPRDTATDSDDRSESESNRLFDREPLGGASASDNSVSTAPDPPSRDGESMQKFIEGPQEIFWGC